MWTYSDNFGSISNEPIVPRASRLHSVITKLPSVCLEQYIHPHHIQNCDASNNMQQFANDIIKYIKSDQLFSFYQGQLIYIIWFQRYPQLMIILTFVKQNRKSLMTTLYFNLLCLTNINFEKEHENINIYLEYWITLSIYFIT